MKLFVWFGAVLLALVVTLYLVGRKSVHAELYIDASPESIWSVLTDTESYSEWNPIFVSIDGVLEEGETVLVGMKLPDGQITPAKVRVHALQENRKLNQFGGTPGLMTYDHYWLLVPEGSGTRVTQHEEYRGIAVPFWDPTWVQEAYEASLQALSYRVLDTEN